MREQRIFATYWLETPGSPERAAAVIAGEQSSGTFVPVPGETDELRERHGARVESLTLLGESSQPSLPGARRPGQDSKWRAARAVISWPFANVGPSLPNLLATVAGNLFELSDISGLRLLDIDLPEEFARAYPGPRCGVEGTRRLTGVNGRPIIGTIVKPSVGLTPAQTADLVRSLVEAGIDFIKDDELMADPPHSPLQERLNSIMPVIEDLAQRHGRKAMYAFNITGEIDDLARRAEMVAGAGGTCVMVSVNSVGLPGVAFLRRRTHLPIHAHRNGWGYLTRCPSLGFDFLAWHKLWRVAGVDHIHTNGLRNKFCEADESVIASARACLTPILGGYEAMPVLSSGQWADQAPDTYRALGSVDLLYLCGGGMMAHPGGPAAGLRSIRQAWDAALAGRTLEEYADSHEELRQALERFGK